MLCMGLCPHAARTSPEPQGSSPAKALLDQQQQHARKLLRNENSYPSQNLLGWGPAIWVSTSRPRYSGALNFDNLGSGATPLSVPTVLFLFQPQVPTAPKAEPNERLTHWKHKDLTRRYLSSAIMHSIHFFLRTPTSTRVKDKFLCFQRIIPEGRIY